MKLVIVAGVNRNKMSIVAEKDVGETLDLTGVEEELRRVFVHGGSAIKVEMHLDEN